MTAKKMKKYKSFVILNRVILTSEVPPLQKVHSEIHNAWIFCDMIGTILYGDIKAWLGTVRRVAM